MYQLGQKLLFREMQRDANNAEGLLLLLLLLLLALLKATRQRVACIQDLSHCLDLRFLTRVEPTEDVE